jgi:hypothetical protein
VLLHGPRDTTLVKDSLEGGLGGDALTCASFSNFMGMPIVDVSLPILRTI